MGWNLVNGQLKPVLMTLPPIPEACREIVSCGCTKGCCREIVSCGCTKGCLSQRCKCRKINLPCTEACKCHGNASHDCRNIPE